MTKFERDVFEKFDSLKSTLNDLDKKIVKLTENLDADYHALHGNGEPGLLGKFSALDKHVAEIEHNLDKRVSDIENDHKDEDRRKADIITWIAIGIEAVGTAWAVFFR